jgi:hypothetical protein
MEIHTEEGQTHTEVQNDAVAILVMGTEAIYDLFFADLTYASLVEEPQWIDYCYFEGGIDNGDPYCDFDFTGEIVQDNNILTTMNKIDSFYDNLIAPNGDGSDGFVQNSSQFYPSTNAVQYVIPGADSHLAATRSPYDHTALDYLLSNVYKVATPPPCPFASNTSLIAVPASGGSFSFGLNTTAGCQWSAVSQNPWISIESSSTSGSNTASITFDVQALSGNVPRSGSVQVGNASNTVTVSVNQASGCSYSLSAAPQLSFPYTGGGATVQVATQTGCTWSASSNESWLTIQNGSGGGSGTFTFAVSRVAGGGTAVIDVMGQTISVTETPQPPHCDHFPGCN